MLPQTILITGVPRSGTTLCCHQLNQLPNVLALVEPMKALELDAAQSLTMVCEQVVDFGLNVRSCLADGRQVMAMNAAGQMPDNFVGHTLNKDGLRQSLVHQSNIDIEKPLSDDFILLIKHNAFFTALLPALSSFFPVFAVIRNPLAVLASWNSVDLPVNQGRVPAGERFSPALARDLAAEPDRLQRQLIILGWFFQQFTRYIPRQNIIRYESLISGHDDWLSAVLPGACLPGLEQKHLKNKNTQYDKDLMRQLAEALCASKGAYWDYYDESAVLSLLD